MSPPSLDEMVGLLDDLFPEEDCKNCKQKKPTIEVKCSTCKFEFKTCAECCSNNRDMVKEALKEHANTCDDGASVLSAMGY